MKYHPVGSNGDICKCDYEPKPLVTNIMNAARRNQNFRTTIWTGHHLQMTLMCIPVYGDIGVEIHPETDQLIRVEEGRALACMGECGEKLDTQRCLGTGDAVFVPSGTWHNVFNTGNCPLKLSSFYAPPQHPKGTIHRTKVDAAHEEH